MHLIFTLNFGIFLPPFYYSVFKKQKDWLESQSFTNYYIWAKSNLNQGQKTNSREPAEIIIIKAKNWLIFCFWLEELIFSIINFILIN